MTERDFNRTYRIPAKCAGCGTEHEVQSFTPPAPDAAPVPTKCDECLLKDEARAKERIKPIAGSTRARARTKKLDQDQLTEVERRATEGQATHEDEPWYNR